MNLQAAADTLGVHYQTAYRWVREGHLTAGKIGGSYDVTETEVQRFLSRRLVPSAPPTIVRVRDWTAQSERFELALREGNELGAGEVIHRLRDGNVAIIDLCEKVVTPCMYSIGESWHNGMVSIGEEHRATAIAERILGRLASQPRGRPRGTAVVTTPPGDAHGLASLMATLVLREDRWKVHHLGSDMPQDDLVKFSVGVNADLVVLSSTLVSSFEAGQRVRNVLERVGIRALIGGPGSTLRMLVSLAREAGAKFEDPPI
jgi:MerR family transcriptional regulator, light-induced transcriptional regulator